jgi:hypothetical protein
VPSGADALLSPTSGGKAAAGEEPGVRRRREGPMQIGQLVFHDVGRIKEALTTVLGPENDAVSWVLLAYSAATEIVLVASGVRPLEELAALLRDDQVQYALLRVPTPGDSTRRRDMFVTWIGPAVRSIEKGASARLDLLAEQWRTLIRMRGRR